MTLGLLFWIIMVVWLLFWGAWWVSPDPRFYHGSYFVLWTLLALLGYKVFGPLLHG
jgi:hypothetical protein